jgi:tetratricopeptide (TPR) repeat protein
MLIKKQIAILIMQIIFCGICFSQTEQIYSLKNLLSSLHDTARVNCLNTLSSVYNGAFTPATAYRQTDSARSFASEAQKEAIALHYTKGIAEAFQKLGEIEYELNNFSGAEKFFLMAVPLYSKINALREMNWTYVWLGYTYSSEGNYDSARNLFEKTLLFYKSINDKENKALAFRSIAETYHCQGYYEKAFEYIQQDFQINKRDNDTKAHLYAPADKAALYEAAGETRLAINYYKQSTEFAKQNKWIEFYYGIMGKIFCLEKKYDSALYYRQLYNNIIESSNTDTLIKKKYLMGSYVNIGEIYFILKEYDKALINFQGSLQYFKNGNDINEVMDILRNIARTYDAEHNVKTLIYAKELLNYAQKSRARPFIRDAYEILWHMYNRQNNVKAAYDYYLKYTAIKDSIVSDEYKRNIALSEMKTKEEQEQTQINLLNKDNQIKQDQLQKQAMIKNIFIVSFIILVLFGLAIFRNIILKRKNEKLQFENKLKEEKLISELKHAALRKLTNELEMEALRTQMNPHFIFNSLNSINMFILENNKLQASEYLSKFSRLIRLILQNSKEAFISLESELEALQLYLELESLRFDNKFEYKISVDEDINTSTLKVPPLIIQPYAENAIWHGLMHKKEKGHLEIVLYQEDEILFCKITDDGIGRRKSAELKSKASIHKSMGIKITESRIEMMQSNRFDKSVEIKDLVYADGSAAGTEVQIKIPVHYD